MKTKEECLLINGIIKCDLGKNEERIIKAMDEYGRQCFKAARELDVDSQPYFNMIEKYENYEDYLKELEK